MSPLMEVQFLKCLIFVAFMESVSLNSPMPIPLQTVKRREMFTPFAFVELSRARVPQTRGSRKGSWAVRAVTAMPSFIHSTNTAMPSFIHSTNTTMPLFIHSTNTDAGPARCQEPWRVGVPAVPADTTAVLTGLGCPPHHFQSLLALDDSPWRCKRLLTCLLYTSDAADE